MPVKESGHDSHHVLIFTSIDLGNLQNTERKRCGRKRVTDNSFVLRWDKTFLPPSISRRTCETEDALWDKQRPGGTYFTQDCPCCWELCGKYMIVVKRMSGVNKGWKPLNRLNLFVDKVDNCKVFLRNACLPYVYSWLIRWWEEETEEYVNIHKADFRNSCDCSEQWIIKGAVLLFGIAT